MSLGNGNGTSAAPTCRIGAGCVALLNSYKPGGTFDGKPYNAKAELAFMGVNLTVEDPKNLAVQVPPGTEVLPIIDVQQSFERGRNRGEGALAYKFRLASIMTVDQAAALDAKAKK